MAPKKQLTIRLAPATLDALWAESSRTGESLSECVDRLLAAGLGLAAAKGDAPRDDGPIVARVTELEERVTRLESAASATPVTKASRPASRRESTPSAPFTPPEGYVLPPEAARLSGVGEAERDAFYARVRRGKHPEWVASDVRTPQGARLYRRRETVG